jgi:hypothetical protein
VGASFVVLLSLSAQSCFAKSVSTRSSWQGGIFDDLRSQASMLKAIKTTATKMKHLDLAIVATPPKDQPTDGGPSVTPELAGCVVGPPLGGEAA